MIEEGQLLRPVLRPVIMRPLLVAVHFQPFLAGAHPAPRFQRAARMQALVGPAGHDIGRGLDRGQVHFLAFPIGIVKRVRLDVGVRVLGAAQREAEIVGPARHEAGFPDSAVIGEFAIPVGKPLPRIDRDQVRRLQRGDEILDRREIGDARHPHLAIGPVERGEPFDAVEAILPFADAVMAQIAFGKPCSARIGEDDGIAVGAPEGGIGRLEGRETRNPARLHPRGGPQAAGKAMLAIGAPAEKDRQVCIRCVRRAIDVHEDADAVAHRHLDVAFDQQAFLDPAIVVRRRQGRLVGRGIGIHSLAHDRFEMPARIRHGPAPARLAASVR